jgi:Cys-tRNA(Pro) deacylase
MSEIPPASLALTEMGITHEIFRHAGHVTSLEQAAAERGQRPEQVIRSIVFRLARDRFIMVLATGRAQISWKNLRQHVGQSRLAMASEAEVQRVTGYRVGAVSPFGLARPIQVVIETGVLQEQLVSIGSGVLHTAVLMSSQNLLAALKGAEIASLTEST